MEHIGLYLYLWFVLGNIETLFTVIYYIFSFIITIMIIIIFLEAIETNKIESLNIFFIKTKKEYEQIFDEYFDFSFEIIQKLKKAIKIFIITTIILLFIPTRTELLTIITSNKIYKVINKDSK